MNARGYFWLIVISGFLALLSFQFNDRPRDFDFQSGIGAKQ